MSITRNHSANALENGDANHRVSLIINIIFHENLYTNVILLAAIFTQSLFQGNTHFMRKIPAGAEASNILVGEVDFLDKTLSAFIRLNQASIMGDLTEVPVPTRFIFILLGPTVSLPEHFM
jgi:sodium bicarbonate transporter 10